MKRFRGALWHLFIDLSLKLQGYREYSGFGPLENEDHCLLFLGQENVRLEYDYRYGWRGITLLSKLTRHQRRLRRPRLPAPSFNRLMLSEIDRRLREVPVLDTDAPLWEGLQTFVEVITTDGKVKRIVRIDFCQTGITRAVSTQRWSQAVFELQMHARRFSRQKVITISEGNTTGILFRYGRKTSSDRAERLIERVITTMKKYGFTELTHSVKATG